MTEFTSKTFDFSKVYGISNNELQQHYKLYQGYVSKINEIDSLSKNANDYKNSNPTFSEMRSIKLGESFALDGVLLHELYFENICNEKGVPSTKILTLIKETFNTFENFINYLTEVGLAARGWAIAGIDFNNNLRIIGSDAHDVGAVWCMYPLIVMDVYEHAYMIDFGIDRKKYIDIFIKNISWNIVNKRFDEYLKLWTFSKNPGRSISDLFPTWNINDLA